MGYTVRPEHLAPWTCPECGFVCKARWAYNHKMWCDPQKSIDRFWSRVDKTSHEGGCWLFMGARDKLGYGDVGFKGRHLQAHRLAWIITNGEPGELDVLHKCNNPPCCNPSHLYLGTDADNARDRCTTGNQPRGERVRGGRISQGATLTAAQVIEIRRDFKRIGKRTNVKELAKRYPNASRDAVYLAATRKTWRHIP